LPPSSAPSAVSRFLNRFSRSRPSSSPSRNSLTLSGNDLEFLSDVRSNSTDPIDTSDEQLEFGSTAASGFLHGKLPPLLPPPLPPPPPPALPLPSLSLPNTTSPPPNLGPLVRNDATNGPTISPVNPNAGVSLDARKPTEHSVFPLIPLIPSPIQAKSSKSMSMHPNSTSSPSDKIIPSLGATSIPTSFSGAIDVPHNDDDDFSDFLSSPADPPLLTFSASPPSQGTVQPSRNRSMSSDNHFANFMSPPPPPGLPIISQRPDTALLPKSAGPPLRMAPANPTSSIAHRRRRSRVEEHMHTLDLVERAAARPGRWPAPPSPLPEVLTPPPPPGPAPSGSADLDLMDIGPAPARSNHQRQPSTSKETITSSPSKAAVEKGHQRTQSLLDLAAARPGRWPAPPSPCHEALLPPPPPPPARNQGGVSLNVDYFGTTPTEESFTFPPPPPPPGKTSPPPMRGNNLSPQMTLGQGAPLSTGVIDRMPSSSPPPHLSAPPAAPLSRRTLSPPPLSAAVISKVPPALASAPIPLLPPPGGYRLTPPLNPPTGPYSPESTPLAFLIGSGSANLPVEKATPPPPVKGTGGLTAQDLSFFEGL
jgi:hypothetical protein